MVWLTDEPGHIIGGRGRAAVDDFRVSDDDAGNTDILKSDGKDSALAKVAEHAAKDAIPSTDKKAVEAPKPGAVIAPMDAKEADDALAPTATASKAEKKAKLKAEAEKLGITYEELKKQKN